MSDVLPIKLQVTGDTKAVAAVRKEIEQLAAASQKTSTYASAAAAKQAAAYSKIQQSAAQAGVANQRLATETQKTATASNQAATAVQRLATEQQRTAAAASKAAQAQTQAAASALKLEQAQTRATQASARANTGMAVLPRTIAGLSHEAASFATASLTMGAAVGVATAAVSSFADAFQFKAQLDATTLAVNAQLKGMRDSGQVWNEASAFAQKFKLTQQETTQAISASIGVMRASKAPVEDILGVLARMQVLSPEQSLEEAAIALKALASGDTTSLVTRFEVGRDVANQMKQEIQGGADAVAVMSKFLGDTGIGMDVLAAKTTGAAGAIKDLAIAQEELKLAQADFAQGPGMAILQAQIAVTQDATKALGGDFQALNAIINDSGVGAINPLLGALAAYNDAALSAGKSALDWATSLFATEGAAQASAAGLAAFDAEMAISGDTIQAEIAYQAAYAAVIQASTVAQHDQSSATNIGTTAFGAYLQAVTTTTAAVSTETQALVDETQAKFASAAEAEKLAKFQADLANLGGAVANGLMTAGNAAGQLAQMYGIATSAAMGLIQAQAALAQAKVNAAAFSDQRAGERNPGASGAAEAAAKEDARLKMIYAKLVTTTKAGGAARASAAGAGAAKLEGIETKTGDKLSQIVQDTQAKLIAIDQKAADERAKIAADLANKIATSAADRRAANEADDLDLIGVTDEKEAQKLNDREKAQAASREREVAAAKEAQDMIANGEAEAASKVYDIRQTQISDQQALDEKYAEKQRELAENEDALAALKTQYDEGTRANEEAANTRIAIAKAEAEQKKAEVQSEKDAVIAAANEQANQVVGAAERSAAGVTKATGAARATAVANLKAIGDAVTAIPANKTITITVNQQGSVGASSAGGGSPNKAAGGGSFMTAGKATITVGDNPGGRELVTVTPLSGKGTTQVSGNLIALAGGGTVDAGGGYTTPIAGGDAAKPKSGGGGKGAPAMQDLKAQLDEQKNIVQLLRDLIQLRGELEAAASQAPFNVGLIRNLLKRAAEFVTMVQNNLIPITKKDGEALKAYVDAAKSAISIIGDTAQLRDDLQENADDQPFDVNLIRGLARRAGEFLQIVQAQLVPMTEFDVELLNRYADAVGSSVGILGDVASLRDDLSDVSTTPFDFALITEMAADAARIVEIVSARLLPITEEQADKIGRYASAVGDSVSILSDVVSLGKDLEEGIGAPITDAVIIRLADQAKRITTLVQGQLVPATEEQTDAASAYADLVGSSVSVLSDVAGLSGKLFADYVSPTDAQITLLATDAQRVAKGFFDAGQIMGKEGAEAGKVYAEGVGAAFSAAKEGLLVIDALKSGDFVLPQGALRQFETSSLDILTTMQALGARAATIPTSDIVALSSVTAAISGQADALIKLAAVPFGNLAGAAQGLGQSGGSLGQGGMTTITNYNTFHLPPGSNQQTANFVIQQLSRQTGARRG